MKNISSLSCFLSFFLAYSCLNAQALIPKVKHVQKYEIEVSKALIDASCGLYPGIGSGIDFVKKNSN